MKSNVIRVQFGNEKKFKRARVIERKAIREQCDNDEYVVVRTSQLRYLRKKNRDLSKKCRLANSEIYLLKTILFKMCNSSTNQKLI